ncbi:MAG: lytic transglycosylase domain-containing protein [Terriglobales bacterium]
MRFAILRAEPFGQPHLPMLAAVGLLALVLVSMPPRASGQRGPDVVEEWSAQLLDSVEQKVQEAERASKISLQLRNPSGSGADVRLDVVSWPNAYTTILYEQAEAASILSASPAAELSTLPTRPLRVHDQSSLSAGIRRFGPMIVPILREHNVPEEMIAVVLIESRFNPAAQSPKGALGLWQLMPATARRFGLNPDGPFDERLDPVRSTRAAARYLSRLYRRWGDWHLVLASYNAGEARVERALLHAQAPTFDALVKQRLLPAETRSYVPSVVSAASTVRTLGIGSRAGRGLETFSLTAAPALTGAEKNSKEVN